MARPTKPSDSTPTLVHVARLAGVGLGTASRALSGQGYVSEETSERIRTAARQLGYQRNELARNLKMKRSGAIGLVVPDIGGPFMVSCVSAIQRVLRQSEYHSMIAFTNGDEKVEAEEIDYLIRHQIDGLIIVPAKSNAAHLHSHQLAQIPVVSFDHPIAGDEYDAVLVNNRRSARMAVEHLINHGHERIAGLGINRHLYSIQKRIEGYRDALNQAKLPRMLEVVDRENDGIGKQLDTWLALKSPPTAIFGLNELASLETVQALLLRGIRMPQDIAFISFDDIPLGPYLDPPVTAVVQPANELGECAATRLLERMGCKEQIPPKRILLDAKLEVRGSCGCGQAIRLRLPFLSDRGRKAGNSR
jgi:LacI family transcriptional regulator